jgi:hypothetical protein
MFDSDAESYKLGREHIRFPPESPLKSGRSSELSLLYNVDQLEGKLGEE